MKELEVLGNFQVLLWVFQVLLCCSFSGSYFRKAQNSVFNIHSHLGTNPVVEATSIYIVTAI